MATTRMVLTLLVLVGVASHLRAADPDPLQPVEVGVEGPDSCRVQVSKSMLSYACGGPDGGLFSGVVIFPTTGSLLVMAPATPWTQEEVSAVASELAGRLEALRKAVAADSRELSSEAVASRDRFVRDLGPYETAVRELAAELGAGKGRDETRPAFENLHRVRRDLILTLGKGWSPTVDTMRQIARASATLARLDGFYVESSSRSAEGT